MKVYWISYEIKNAPQDAHLRVWKNVAYATALGARVRLRTLFYERELIFRTDNLCYNKLISHTFLL